MPQSDPFAPVLRRASPPTTADLHQKYQSLQATWGDALWGSVEGTELLRELEREDVTENRGEFVFSDPKSIVLLWDVLDHLDWGSRNLLIVGERGVGKEVIAKVIGYIRKQDVISVNCASLVETIADSQLFGIAKNSGVAGVGRGGKQGYVGAADGKVLFLDEFFEAPPSISAKLLRLLQQPRTYQQVGSTKDISLDEKTVIVAASNRYPTISQLEVAMLGGDVRSDLIDRFQARVELPPLRARKREIGDLAKSVLKRLPGPTRFHSLDTTTTQALRHADHGWPGNVRELESLIATQARLQRHTSPADGLLRISEPAFRAWLASAQKRADAFPRPSNPAPSSSYELSAWEATKLKKLRLRQLLLVLLAKRTSEGVALPEARWVSNSIAALLAVDNVSQKLKDTLGLNVHQLTSLLNKLSDTAEHKLDELVMSAFDPNKSK